MNFIEIDRSILKSIGFKNTFSEEKDKNGNLKIDDETGNPKLMDNRHDFKSATRSLRRRGFKEGTGFADPNAHFVIKKVKVSSNNQRGGHKNSQFWFVAINLKSGSQSQGIRLTLQKKMRMGLYILFTRKETFKGLRLGTLQILQTDCKHYK